MPRAPRGILGTDSVCERSVDQASLRRSARVVGGARHERVVEDHARADDGQQACVLGRGKSRRVDLDRNTGTFDHGELTGRLCRGNDQRLPDRLRQRLDPTLV